MVEKKDEKKDDKKDESKIVDEPKETEKPKDEVTNKDAGEGKEITAADRKKQANELKGRTKRHQQQYKPENISSEKYEESTMTIDGQKKQKTIRVRKYNNGVVKNRLVCVKKEQTEPGKKGMKVIAGKDKKAKKDK